MSVSPSTPLTDGQVLVLYVVWERHQQAELERLKGRPISGMVGLTNDQIRDAVIDLCKKRNLTMGTSIHSIKPITKKLSGMQPPLLAKTAKAGHKKPGAKRAGNKPSVYSLAYDNIVHSRTTASLLIHLVQYIGEVKFLRADLISQIEEQNMVKTGGRPFSGQQISDALSFCLNTPNPYVYEPGDGSIAATERVKHEMDFLEMIRWRPDESIEITASSPEPRRVLPIENPAATA